MDKLITFFKSVEQFLHFGEFWEVSVVVVKNYSDSWISYVLYVNPIQGTEFLPEKRGNVSLFIYTQNCTIYVKVKIVSSLCK